MKHPSRPLKILVIRFSSIGDIVLCSPVVRGLKQQIQAEVHFLTKKNFKGIVEANPYVDKVFALDKDIAELLPLLRREKYDRIIDLHHNLRSLRVRLALGVKSHAFDKINLQKWLMVNFKLNFLPDRHIVDRYLDTVKSLGISNDEQGLDYFVPPDSELDPWVLSGRTGFPEGQPYIVVVIGAAHATKRLSRDRLVELCSRIKQPVILLGGPEDKAEGEAIAEAVGKQVWSACGHFSLHQSASIVRQAAVVVTHDTGLMHIAAAFHKKIIAVWGNTIPEFGMYPYYPKGMDRHFNSEVQPLSCRPCSKIGFESCPKKHFSCMEKQGIPAIARLAEQFCSGPDLTKN